LLRLFLGRVALFLWRGRKWITDGNGLFLRCTVTSTQQTGFFWDLLVDLVRRVDDLLRQPFFGLRFRFFFDLGLLFFFYRYRRLRLGDDRRSGWWHREQLDFRQLFSRRR
jgi:hypothetical protein